MPRISQAHATAQFSHDLERKNFLNRNHEPTAVRISAPPDDPHFLIEIAPPPDLDQLTRVNVQLWPVEILASGLAASWSDGKATVEIKRRKEEVPGSNPGLYVPFDVMKRELSSRGKLNL